MPEGDRRRRVDAERSRAALINAAARQLAEGPIIDMRRLAQDAGLSRSTVYRHFPSADGVRQAVVQKAMHDARLALRSVMCRPRPPLALLRDAVSALVRVGATHSLAQIVDLVPDSALATVADEAMPIVERVAALSDVAVSPPPGWTRLAVEHAVLVCLTAARPGDDVRAAADHVVRCLSEPLDRGLVIVDRSGGLVAANAAGATALALDEPTAGQAALGPRVPAYFEDGTRCPNDAYPTARAVLEDQTQEPVVRGHRFDDGAMRWYAVSAFSLQRGTGRPPYGVLTVFADITDERDAALEQLPRPGSLGRSEPVRLDVARVLDAVPAHLLPDQIIAEARRLVEAPVALYVVDIDGTHLLRLAGADAFPGRIRAPLALGPELDPDGIPRLRERLEQELAGCVMAPLWLRGRAVGILLASGGRQDVLDEVAHQAAPAIELANGYTDVFDAVRRRKDMNPAGEIQQSLLPPRIARFGSGLIAGGVLPSYETGGDWFDYVENRDGAWLAMADAAGRGPRAAALGAIALAALRAERRNDATLEAATQTVHETLCSASDEEFFMTAIFARWSPMYASFSWVNAGHPRPLLLKQDGTVLELGGAQDPPLGIDLAARSYRRNFRRLDAGDRLILYTDGISTRRVGDELFGVEGIAHAALAASRWSASAIARSIQEHVVAASDQPLRDDAAVVVLAPAGD